MRIVIILVIVVILASLASALFYLVRDQGQSERTVKALTVRIGISIALMVFIGICLWLGILPLRN